MEEPEGPQKWNTLATKTLRDAMRTQGVTNATLVDRLAELGIVEISEKNFSRKLAKGAFSAAFLLQCLHAMGTDTLKLPPVAL